MSQAIEINLKKTSPLARQKRCRKMTVYLCVFGLIPSLFLYWHYLDRLTHVRVPAKSSHGADTASATGKSKSTGNAAKTADKSAPAKTDAPAPGTDAPAGFVDSLMSVLSPSAQAVTMQPEMRPARKVTKTVTTRNLSQIPSVRELLPLTAEQKRLKLAQAGFSEVMDLAGKYPDAYGFQSDEDMQLAKLGEPIPVYMVRQPDRTDAVDQSVNSMLKPADEWVFPVILENHIRFMVQVRYNGHDYVLGHGSRALAMDYDKIVTRWPASEGFHPQLVIHPNRLFYYFTIPELPDQNLTDTSRTQDFSFSLTPARVILASWR